jgi:hypothetical protein
MDNMLTCHLCAKLVEKQPFCGAKWAKNTKQTAKIMSFACFRSIRGSLILTFYFIFISNQTLHPNHPPMFISSPAFPDGIEAAFDLRRNGPFCGIEAHHKIFILQLADQ